MNNNPTIVILHCAAVPDVVKSKFSIEDITRWHKERGFKACGYHYYITRAGELQKGRPDNVVGAHTHGHNQDSIGVCYEGTYFPTIVQIDAFFNLYRNIREIHKIDYRNWFGHNQFSTKECPGFDIEDLKRLFMKLA